LTLETDTVGGRAAVHTLGTCRTDAGIVGRLGGTAGGNVRINEDIETTGAIADAATAEAVAAHRSESAAGIFTLLRLLAVIGIVLLWLEIVWAARLVARRKQATYVDVTTVIPGPAVAVEKAILLDCINIIAGNSGGEGALVVVRGSRALGIGTVNEAIAIVVDAIATFRAGSNTAIRQIGERNALTIAGARCRVSAVGTAESAIGRAGVIGTTVESRDARTRIGAGLAALRGRRIERAGASIGSRRAAAASNRGDTQEREG